MRVLERWERGMGGRMGVLQGKDGSVGGGEISGLWGGR